MKKTVIVDALFGYKRIALLEENELKEIIVEEKESFNIGDIFVAKVKKILPQKFAFLDLGYEKNAFLGLNDKKQKNLYTYDDKTKKHKLNIKQGQDLIVQIDREGSELKGASVTTNINITGKYAVLLLNEESVAISKKIDKIEKRHFLKYIAKDILPKGYGVIFRTNCNEAEEDIIKNEILALVEQAKNIKEKGEYIKAPSILDFGKTEAEKLIIDLLKEEDQVITNCAEEYEKLKEIFPNAELYKEDMPIFEAYSIETKMEKALQKKVWLKSGGFLIIDDIEAMTIIDINTGKNINKNFEEMIFKTNMEAVEQIAQEIRIRNISGMILIDFIDMKNPDHIEKIEMYMKEMAKKDRMPIVTYPINELGIMQITRKKMLKPLYETVTKPCPMCVGTGKVKNEMYIIHTIKNQIISIFDNTIYSKIIISSSSNIINTFKKNIKFKEIEDKFGKNIEFKIILTARFDYFELEKSI